MSDPFGDNSDMDGFEKVSTDLLQPEQSSRGPGGDFHQDMSEEELEQQDSTKPNNKAFDDEFDDTTPVQDKDSNALIDSFDPTASSKSSEKPYSLGSEFDPIKNEDTSVPDSDIVMQTREVTPPPEAKPEPPVSSSDELEKPRVDSTTSDDEKPVELPKQAFQTNLPTRSTASCMSCSAWLKTVDPKVWEVLLWRKPIVTGPILAVCLLILLYLNCSSILTVVSNIGLLVLTAAVAVRIGKFVMTRVHKGDDVHPFQELLTCDIALSEARVEEIAVQATEAFNTAVNKLRALILVQDFIASLKFGIILYVIGIIGSWFNGLTLLILAVTGAFTLPKIYEANKNQIDQYVAMLENKFYDVYRQLQEKVPFLKNKQKTQ